MQVRYDFPKTAPSEFKALLALEAATVQNSNLDKTLLHMIKIRASQINGCTYCVNMHINEARADQVSQQQLDLLCVWQEAQVFSAKERAILGWTEAITLIADSGAPDQDYEAMREFFSEQQVASYTLAISTINAWNRMALTARSVHPVMK